MLSYDWELDTLAPSTTYIWPAQQVGKFIVTFLKDVLKISLRLSPPSRSLSLPSPEHIVSRRKMEGKEKKKGIVKYTDSNN